MKTISANLQSHIEQETTSLAVLWKIVRQDATELYFTNHDENITYDGDLYESQSGFSATAIEANNRLSVNNQEVVGFAASTQIDEDDLRNGLFDYATVYVSFINYNSIADGIIAIQRGILGEAILHTDGTFSVEIRGMSQIFTQNIGEKFYPECNVDLGGTKCGINLASITVSDTVATVTDRTTFSLTSATGVDDLYNLGLLTFTSGDNAGQSIEILDWTLIGKEIVLYLPARKTIQVGDGVDFYPGCDKRLETCRDVFDNVINFRGFPHAPGDRFLYSMARK